jgi:uncharacterized protein YdeI (YjbR/CyaY-like superfamily)
MAIEKDKRVDAYIEKAPAYAKPILKRLRSVVHASCPRVEETIKWGKPWFIYQGRVMCGIVAFKAHTAFLFNNAKSIAAAKGASAKIPTGQIRRITKVSDLPSASILKAHVKRAMKLNEPGVKRIKKKIDRNKPPAKAPRDLVTALHATPKALASFKKMSESIKRHYVEWITQAKTEETREKRLEKAVESIAAGKTRHWL